MFIRKTLLANLTGVGLLLIVASGVAVAQTPMDMPAHSPEPTNQFRRIDQPLSLKISITTSGLALIWLELCWFLMNKPRNHA